MSLSKKHGDKSFATFVHNVPSEQDTGAETRLLTVWYSSLASNFKMSCQSLDMGCSQQFSHREIIPVHSSARHAEDGEGQ